MASTLRQDLLNLPNTLTMLRIVVIPLLMWLMYLGDPWSCCLAALVFAGAAITDFFDGYLARKRGLVSLTGKFLDPLADKLIVMAALLMLVSAGHLPAWLVVLIIGRELSVQGLRSLAAGEGIVISARGAARYKTAFQLIGTIALIAHYEYEIDFFLLSGPVNFHRAGYPLLLISVALSLWSGAEYFWGFLKGIGQLGQDES